MALDEAIEHTPRGYASYSAFCRVRRKLGRNMGHINVDTTADHRKYVPWVKHEHGSKEDDEVAAEAKAEAERIQHEKELEKERLENERWERNRKADAFVEAHNDAVSYY